jgi:hypothetical protein
MERPGSSDVEVLCQYLHGGNEETMRSLIQDNPCRDLNPVLQLMPIL